jgi:ribonuclease HII
MAPHFKLEKRIAGAVCGIDEVGRGPLAGPVLAACVHIAPGKYRLPCWKEVRDSKEMTAKRREALYALIAEHSIWAVGEAAPEEIDSLNIHHATLLAMSRAYDTMRARSGLEIAHALVDGLFAPKIACACEPVVKGDGISVSIAAASIIAKVTRDRMMGELHLRHPHYGWDTNAGYGTEAHLQALKTHGVTPHHRRSFAPVRAAAEREAA